MEFMIRLFAPRMVRFTVILALSADLAACATEQPREHVHHRRPEGVGGDTRGQLFISPAGKPFRAGPGDPYPVAQWFADADADHDGKLTRAELRQDAAAFFHELDVDKDGVIDGPEVFRYEHSVAPEILGLVARNGGGPQGGSSQGGGSRGGGMGGHGGGRHGGGRSGGPSSSGGGSGAREAAPQGAGLYSLINQPEPVAAADTDFDGKITLPEFLAASDRHFAALDTAGAGFLTLSGLPQTPVQARDAAHRNHPHQD